MKVLVDTPLWSLALRRHRANLNPVETRLVAELEDLIREGRVILLGIVRQEVLSGVTSGPQFERLAPVLRTFPDEPVSIEDHEQAASCFNRCRSHGIQGSTADFLISAVAMRLNGTVFTTDEDFRHYAGHLPLHLHQLR
jgi:predicted nucleic acid-binding protein